MIEGANDRRQGFGRWSLLALIAWCSLIFGTSSTVILPPDFFAWMQEHVLGEGVGFRAFVTFWGLAWFTVVKSWHAIEYAVLFRLALAALDWWRRAATSGNIVLALLLAVGFAASDEYHQTFVPGRGGTLRDVGIDALGASLAALYVLRSRATVRQREKASGTSTPQS